MAVTMARHVESVVESGAASVVMTHQGVVEPRSIRRREWSRFVAITTACRVEPVAGSGAVSIVVTCQRVVEPCGIHRREWSRVMAITVACQGVQAYRPKLG